MKGSFKVEQINAELSIVEDYDQTLSMKEIVNALNDKLGKEYLKNLKIQSQNVNGVLYKKDGIEHTIIFKAISYLGNPHKIHKKRMQLSEQHAVYLKDEFMPPNERIHFIGVYHYEGLILFVDFNIANKNRKTLSNSIHVHTNDLYQGLKNKIFHKTDKNGNELTVIHGNYLSPYLDGELGKEDNELFGLFKKFNEDMKFNEWITVMEALPYMLKNNGQWRQTEWPGFFLENKFGVFIEEKGLQQLAEMTARSNKSRNWNEGVFDFDVFFPKHDFYGDLKCSDINQKKAIGNDQETFLECINRYDRFWYIIYEHETLLDKNMNPESFEGTKFRSSYINSMANEKKVNELSYKNKLKHSIKFSSMKILELNRVNFRKILSDFNQGKQPDGSARKKKFLIDKRSEDDDNLVVFRHVV